MLQYSSLFRCLHEVMTGCGRASRWVWALWLLGQLRAECKANVFSFNAALHACERRGLWQTSQRLLEQMMDSKVPHTACSLRTMAR